MMLTPLHLWEALGSGPWQDVPGSQAFSDVVVDSRLASPGSLFVALPGESADGHQYVGDALDRGAQAALIHKPVADCTRPVNVGQPLLEQGPLQLPLCFLVQDTLQALQQLAAYWRLRHTGCHVVGVTGSVGKTTTKELIAAVLARRFCTLKSLGNYNNEIGLPLTVLRLGAGVEWAVLEMGMYGVGEIAHLASIARPEIGVVTNVGPVHLERLGSVDKIAEAKAELVESLPADGLAVLNGDDPRVRAMRARVGRSVLYGLQANNDLWADEIRTLGLEGLRLRLHYKDQSVHVRLPLLGRHSVYGALAAVAVGLHVGLEWEDIFAGLRDPSAQVRLLVTRGAQGATLLDDSYNASPASTVAALNLLVEMDGRKVAVLGDMLELGAYETEGHRLVGRRAAEVAELLVSVGRRGRIIAEEALQVGMLAEAVHSVASNDEAVELLQRLLREGDFVLVKGSRGMAMEGIVARLEMAD
jgi:UDP-N-acetylmuramoyl-tripeptide--D-alanyl-D-alanine ligase